MRLLLLDHYRTARQSLDRARIRTLLTITGVAIGVASITAILALSAGVSNVINTQVSGLSSKVAVIRPAENEVSLKELSNPTPQTAYTTSPLTERDLDAIRELKATDDAAALMTISGSIRTKTVNPARSTLVATTPSLGDISNLKVADGQFIDSVTREETAVLGAHLSVDLFGTDDSIGKNFFIRGQQFTVIGVLERQNAPLNYNNINFDHAAIISLDSGKLFNEGVAQIQQINVQAKRGTNMQTFRDKLNNTLRVNHDNENDVAVLIGSEIARPSSRFFSFISTAMSIIAGISLLVGGIGIMNIMLVSVSERTREIGLRKAVGASAGMIVWQFMIEALIISLLGGLIGYVSGYIIAFTISIFIPYDPVLTWAIAGWAAALSVGVGIIFGLYPAIRAARKDPIESLRRYH